MTSAYVFWGAVIGLVATIAFVAWCDWRSGL